MLNGSLKGSRKVTGGKPVLIKKTKGFIRVLHIGVLSGFSMGSYEGDEFLSTLLTRIL